MNTNILYLKRFAPQSGQIEPDKEDIGFSDVICTYNEFKLRLLNELNNAKNNMMSLSDIVDTLVGLLFLFSLSVDSQMLNRDLKQNIKRDGHAYEFLICMTMVKSKNFMPLMVKS